MLKSTASIQMVEHMVVSTPEREIQSVLSTELKWDVSATENTCGSKETMSSKNKKRDPAGSSLSSTEDRETGNTTSSRTVDDREKVERSQENATTDTERENGWKTYLWSQAKIYGPKVKDYSSRVVKPKIHEVYKKGYEKVRSRVNDPELRERVQKTASDGVKMSKETWRKYVPFISSKVYSTSQQFVSQALQGAARVGSSSRVHKGLRKFRNYTLFIFFGGMFMYGLGKGLPSAVVDQYSCNRRREEGEERSSRSSQVEHQQQIPHQGYFSRVYQSIEHLAGKETAKKSEEVESNAWTSWRAWFPSNQSDQSTTDSTDSWISRWTSSQNSERPPNNPR